jgi:hypothetical protein
VLPSSVTVAPATAVCGAFSTAVGPPPWLPGVTVTVTDAAEVFTPFDTCTLKTSGVLLVTVGAVKVGLATTALESVTLGPCDCAQE